VSSHRLLHRSFGALRRRHGPIAMNMLDTTTFHLNDVRAACRTRGLQCFNEPVANTASLQETNFQTLFLHRVRLTYMEHMRAWKLYKRVRLYPGNGMRPLLARRRIKIHQTNVTSGIMRLEVNIMHRRLAQPFGERCQVIGPNVKYGDVSNDGETGY
jgi:hypothetical protein